MKKIKVAIWGLGRAAQLQHIPEINKLPDLYKIAGCYDILPQRSAEIAQRTNSHCYNSVEEMLQDSEVELVSIVTRHADHVPQAIQAIEAGKRVFLEKPLAVSFAQLQALKDTADKHPHKLFCRHNRRFLSEFRAVHDVITSGILGDIKEIRLSEEWYKRRQDWQTLKACGGGLLNNWGPHLIDQGLQLLESPVTTVWAKLSHYSSMGDAEDSFKILLHGENDRVIEINACEGAAIPAAYCVVYGSMGMLEVQNNRNAMRVRSVNQDKTPALKSAVADTPDTDQPYDDASIVWDDEIINIDRKHVDWHDSYRFLFDGIRVIQEYPIKNEDAFEVVRMLDLVRTSNGQTISAQ